MHDETHPHVKCYTAEVKEDFKGRARIIRFASTDRALIDGRYLLIGHNEDKDTYCGDYQKLVSNSWTSLFPILPYNEPYPEEVEESRWVVFGPTYIDAPKELEDLSLTQCEQDMGGNRRLDACLHDGQAIQWIKLRAFLRKTPD